MSYVSGFLHDVFISYACADDKPAGLVRHFRKLLAEALATEGLRVRGEGGPEGVDIFLDNRTLESGEDLTEQVLTAARSTAVFIALHSPAYLVSEWCGKEAAEFTTNFDPERPKLKGRLFMVALGARGTPAESPIEALQSRRFRRFFYEHEDGKSFPFDPDDPSRRNPDGYTLREEAKMMAEEIATTLRGMQKEVAMPQVFLGETTRERAPHAEDIKKWLLQKQVIVLRASGGGTEWEAQSRALLQQCDLFVDVYEAVPTEAGRKQAALAAELGKKAVRWLPRGELTAESSLAAMRQTNLVEETLEGFKASLLSLLAQPSERFRPPQPPPPQQQRQQRGQTPANTMVVLVGATNDITCTEQIEGLLEQLQCGHDALVTDDIIGDPDGWLKSLQDMLELHQPALVAFVDGQCAGSWRDARLRSLIMFLREAAPETKRVLCAFPPIEKKDRRLKPSASQMTLIDSHGLEQLKGLLGLAT